MERVQNYLIMMVIILFGTLQIMRAESRLVDPMSDFRTPQSLTELLHEGLNNIYCTLVHTQDVQDRSAELLKVHKTFEQIHVAYDSLLNRSHHDALFRVDKEFLEKMLDKIDALIAELESDSQSASEDEEISKHHDLQEIKNMSDDFRQKVMH